MVSNNKVVRIFTMPQEFPCGPQASCCGPVGQSEEEVKALSAAVEELGVEVEVHNVKDMNDLANYQNVLTLLRSFGLVAVPVLTVGDEVVSIGVPTPEQAVSAVKGNLE